MQKLFFDKFPEYKGYIPVHVEQTRAAASPLGDSKEMVGVNSTFVVPECGSGKGFGEVDGSFNDVDVMALFDEIPPT
jgi:hypothetical protein